MAIGTAAAIGLGVAGVGSILGASSSNRNSRRAAAVSQENNEANVALQREIYGQNRQALSPFMQRGNAAGGQINALLGLGGSPAQQAQQPNALSQFQGGPMGGFGGGMGGYNPALARDMAPITSSNFGGGQGPNAFWQQQMPTGMPGTVSGYGGGTFNTDGTQVTPTGGQTAQQAAESGFDIFRNSTGYEFRLGEGMNALNSGYAGAGVLQSGDAIREATEYGQNFASNEFGNYMGYLGQQQAVGAGAASSLAGVGQNFANSVSQQNTMNAANQANAITSRQSPFANALGMVGGGLFQFGMG